MVLTDSPVRLVHAAATDRTAPLIAGSPAAPRGWRERRAQRRALRQAAARAGQEARADRRARQVAIATLAVARG